MKQKYDWLQDINSEKDNSRVDTDQTMNAGAGGGAMGRFAELQGDSASGQQALADALALTGLPVDIEVVDSADIPNGVPMRYDLDQHRIEVNTNIQASRALMAQYMAEELLHAVDHLGCGYTLSAGSRHLYFGIGKITLDVQNHYLTDGYFAEFISYPLNPMYDLTQDRIKAELFARLGVLYFAHPETLKRELPIAYEVYHELFGLSQSSPHDGSYIRSKIWTASRGGRSMGGDHGANPEAGTGHEGRFGKGSANHGLERLLSAVATALDAPRHGRKARL